jgi:hypothetical protein
MAFNAMAVESGSRVVLATYALPESSAMDLGTLTNFKNIDVVTAARLSASFPYVTPFPRAAGSDGTNWHIADGGYWDNHGVMSALEWLRAAGTSTEGRPVVLIRIPPLRSAAIPARDRPWSWQVPATFAALNTMRMDAQRVRNSRDVEVYRAANGAFREFEFPADDSRAQPLSWHISRDDRCQIQEWWQGSRIRGELKTLESILGPAATSAPSTGVCR